MKHMIKINPDTCLDNNFLQKGPVAMLSGKQTGDPDIALFDTVEDLIKETASEIYSSDYDGFSVGEEDEIESNYGNWAVLYGLIKEGIPIGDPDDSFGEPEFNVSYERLDGWDTFGEWYASISDAYDNPVIMLCDSLVIVESLPIVGCGDPLLSKKKLRTMDDVNRKIDDYLAKNV